MCTICFGLLIVFDVPVIIRQIVVSIQWPYLGGALVSNRHGKRKLTIARKLARETSFFQSPLLVKQ